MDIFEEQAAEHQLRGILLAWASFKVVIPQLLNSYTIHVPEGQLYPPEIEEPNETSIVIVCQRGGAPKTPFSSLTIRIQSEMVSEGKFSIDCKIEEWRKALSGTVSLEWEKSMIFVLASDRTSLIFAKTILTPSQAAAKLLKTALLSK